MKVYINFLATLLVLGLGLKACSSESNTSNVFDFDYVSLIDSLRAAGATVEPTGEISQPFFSVKGRIIKVNGGDVQVFEFTDADDTEAEAEKVSPDGKWVDKTHVNWVATPHFYKKGRLIVLYVGDDSAVKEVLETVLEPQFAGG